MFLQWLKTTIPFAQKRADEKRLESELDTERQKRGRGKLWRSVGAIYNVAMRGYEAGGLALQLENRKNSGCVRQSPRRRSENERRIRLGHAFAAIHARLTLGRTMHGLATLHGLLCRRHGLAVRGIRSESDHEKSLNKWPSPMH